MLIYFVARLYSKDFYILCIHFFRKSIETKSILYLYKTQDVKKLFSTYVKKGIVTTQVYPSN